MAINYWVKFEKDTSHQIIKISKFDDYLKYTSRLQLKMEGGEFSIRKDAFIGLKHTNLNELEIDCIITEFKPHCFRGLNNLNSLKELMESNKLFKI